MKLTKRVIKDEAWIDFVDMTEKYGRAEWVICPVYKRGKLVEAYIYPMQQPEARHFYVWQGKSDGYYFQSYQGLDAPKIWRNAWCKEHKCNSVELYVPTGSKYLHVSMSIGSLHFDFTKTKWG